jgi:hypothetical protein
LALLSPLNVFLRDLPDARPVPVAKRLYELYGDEKYLARPEPHQLVVAGLLSIAKHLRAFAAPAPLAMFELGPAPWALIVENSAAFTNLRRFLASWPASEEVGWLAYGGGDHLVASIAAFAERRHPVPDCCCTPTWTSTDSSAGSKNSRPGLKGRSAGVGPGSRPLPP